MIKRSFLSVLIFLLIGITSYGEVLQPVKWSYNKKELSSGEYELIFSATIDKGWHMYGINIEEGGPIPTSFTFNPVSGIELLGEISPDKAPEKKFDKTFELDVELFDNQVTFSQKIKVNGYPTLSGSIEFMACNDETCTPPNEFLFDFSFASDGKQSAVSTKREEKESASLPDFKPAIEEAIDLEESAIIEDSELDTSLNETETPKEEKKSMLRLFLLAIGAGFAALLTPCVFPIIPLTVSFFMRESSKSKAIFNGVAFGLSIVIIYTLVGLIVGLSKVDLVRLISSNPIPNVLFFLIFIALAASFFGLFELTLPSSLSNKIDQRADKGGLLGPFFMALATVVISFSCTGPIVGIVLGSAMQGEVITPVVGMFGFSIAFALPFALLAMFPSLLKNMPKSGGWLNSVKVVFAFIMLAFSLLFLTNLGIVNRSIVLSILIVIFSLQGFYLLGKIKFSHDSDLPYVSVSRIILAIASFSVAVYLIPGLFGAELKKLAPFLPEKEEASFSFAQPQSSANEKGIVSYSEASGNICSEKPKYSDKLHLPHKLKGYFDYDEALACAKELNKPLLIDFVGHSCKNCKKMYAEVLSDKVVHKKISDEFVMVAMYTDDKTKLPESEWITSTLDGRVKNTLGKKNLDFQVTKFKTNALPMYVIVNPDGEILTNSRDYYTYSNDVGKFIEFLDEGLSK